MTARAICKALGGRSGLAYRAVINNDSGAVLIWELAGEAGALAPTFSLRN